MAVPVVVTSKMAARGGQEEGWKWLVCCCLALLLCPAAAVKVIRAGEGGWVVAGSAEAKEELPAWWSTGAEGAGAATGFLEREHRCQTGERGKERATAKGREGSRWLPLLVMPMNGGGRGKKERPGRKKMERWKGC